MRKLFLFLIYLLGIINLAVCQQPSFVLSYPYKFQSAPLLKKSEAHCNFIENIYTGKIIMTLFDYVKAEYVELDSNFKFISKFNIDRASTVSQYDYKRHIGATIGKDVYYNVYRVIDKEIGKLESYFVETINFATQKVSVKKLIELPEEEEMLASFSDYGVFSAITVNSNISTIGLYELKPNGELFRKSFSVKVPDNVGKKRNKLADYLEDTKLMKSDTEPWLPETGSENKIYSLEDKYCLSVNFKDSKQTRLIWIDKKNYTLTENQIDHSSLVEKDGFVNSFLYEDKLFAFIQNDNTIKLGVYASVSGKLLKLQELNDDNMSLLAESPVEEERYEFRQKVKDFSSIKKFNKSSDRGYRGLFVLPNAKGQLVVTMGNFFFYPKITNTYQMNTPQAAAASGSVETKYTTIGTYRLRTYYIPAEFSYNTNYIKLILDAVTLQPAKGPIPKSARKSVNERLGKYPIVSNGITGHFSIKNKQYVCFYYPKTNSLIADIIPLTN